MGSLDRFINDSVDDSKCVEFQLNAVHRAIGDLLVLLIEVVKELCLLVTLSAFRFDD